MTDNVLTPDDVLTHHIIMLRNAIGFIMLRNAIGFIMLRNAIGFIVQIRYVTFVYFIFGHFN